MAIVRQVDIVVNFASSIMSMIQSIPKQPGEDDDEKEEVVEVKVIRKGIKMTVFNNKKKAIFRSIKLLETGHNTYMVCNEDDGCNGEVKIKKVTKEEDDLYWLYLVQIKWNEEREEYEDV